MIKHYVYLIQCNGKKGPVKIGVAENVSKRINDLQTGNPYKLEIIAQVEFESKMRAYEIEKQLHKRFKRYHIRGEWFKHFMLRRLPNIQEGEIVSDYHFTRIVDKENMSHWYSI